MNEKEELLNEHWSEHWSSQEYIEHIRWSRPTHARALERTWEEYWEDKNERD